jgi:hypothetical protein
MTRPHPPGPRRSNRGPIWLPRLALLGALAVALPGCSDCSLSITTNDLPDGVVGENYFAPLNSECGGDVWSIWDDSPPPGIELQNNGDIQGVPTLPGTYIFTVAVFDYGSGETAYKGLSITIRLP